MRKKPFDHALSAMLSALCIIGALLFAFCFPAEAQQPRKVYRIGYLSSSSRGFNPRVEAFRKGLRELGYIERQNILPVLLTGKASFIIRLGTRLNYDVGLPFHK